MRNIASCLLGTVIGVSGAHFAAAADLPSRAYAKAPMVAQTYDWSGFYVGVNAGGAWGRSTSKIDQAPANFLTTITAGALPTSAATNQDGFFAGGQVGYNWQVSNWVIGLETDIQGANIGKAATISTPPIGFFFPSETTTRDRIDWFGTMRGRIGMAFDHVLVYGTGGLAYGGVKTSYTTIFDPTNAHPETITGNNSDARLGWAAGAGVEWAFAPKWTVKGEYLHVDLGSSSLVAVDLADPFRSSMTYRFKNTFDAARIGVNYKFGGSAEPRN